MSENSSRRPTQERNQLSKKDLEEIEKLRSEVKNLFKSLVEQYQQYYKKWSEERKKYMELLKDVNADPLKRTNAKNRTEHAAAKCHRFKRNHLDTQGTNLIDEDMKKLRRKLIALGSNLPAEICDYIVVLSRPEWKDFFEGDPCPLPPRRYNVA